jgi:hypothetical protein
MRAGASLENRYDFGFHTLVFNHAAAPIAVRIAPLVPSA